MRACAKAKKPKINKPKSGISLTTNGNNERNDSTPDDEYQTNTDIYANEKNFEEKIRSLRNHLEFMKVDWREAHCNMELGREEVLKESMMKFKKIDPYKELKINFQGEVSYDAGGIIREWFTVIVKELQSSQLSKNIKN